MMKLLLIWVVASFPLGMLVGRWLRHSAARQGDT